MISIRMQSYVVTETYSSKLHVMFHFLEPLQMHSNEFSNPEVFRSRTRFNRPTVMENGHNGFVPLKIFQKPRRSIIERTI